MLILSPDILVILVGEGVAMLGDLGDDGDVSD